MYVAFLDLKSAFDEVQLNQIWRVLHEKKVPTKLIKTLKAYTVMQKERLELVVNVQAHSNGETALSKETV